jgi:hypothetical protein
LLLLLRLWLLLLWLLLHWRWRALCRRRSLRVRRLLLR